MEGISKSKKLGLKFGGKNKLSDQQISDLQTKRGQRILIKELMLESNYPRAASIVIWGN